jgi:streptogramin lyase
MTATGVAASEWTVSNLAGTGIAGFSGDGGPASAAQITDPYGIVRGPDGAIWFCEHGTHRIRRIAPDGTISTIAGTGQKGYTGDGGPATQATFNLPHELRFDTAGNLYVADTGNDAVRRIDLKTGVITTFAGNGRKGETGDGGPASDASVSSPHSIQISPDDTLYICDVPSHIIRRVDLHTGIITTFAGTGKAGPTPDGAPIAGTPLNNPRSLDVDREGNLWVVTREGNQVFKFDLKAGVIRLVAGTGQPGFTGNGGPAREAKLSGPKGITLDAAGNAWLADTESHTVRMIESSTGLIKLVAGTGVKGDGSDGDPLLCAMNRPHGVFADKDGSIFIGDSEANRIRVLRLKK